MLFGSFIGIFIFGNILEFLFNTYESQSKFAFIGLILGSVPLLLKKSLNNAKVIKIRNLLYTILAFLLTLFLVMYENSSTFHINLLTSFPIWYLVICGFFMSMGVIVPGVSSTVILMFLGIYSSYLEAISTLNIEFLFPLGIGLVIGCIIWLNIIKWLLANYHTETLHLIIGFVLGSILILYPGFSLDIGGIISIVIFILCFIISYKLEAVS